MSDTCSDRSASFGESLALLTLDEAGVPAQLHKDVFDCAWAGAALLDLAFAGRIDTDLDGLEVIDPTPTGAPAIDHALAAIAGRPGLDARGWIRELSGGAETIRHGALAALTGRGILAARPARRKGFGARHRQVWLDAEERTSARRRLLATLRAADVPDPWDAALVALLDACDLLANILSAEEVERASERLAQLRRLDLIGREVAGAVADVERSVVLAVRAQTARLRRRLLTLGAASAIACLAILLLPRIDRGERFGATLRERLWFDGSWQEWSGYALLAAAGVALVAAGLARRRQARTGSAHWWRLAHLGLGALSLALLVAHTGLRLGANLNAALMIGYLAALLLGALAGVATYGAAQLRRLGMPPWLRGVFLRWHLLALLPLPALLTVHVLVVYAY